MCLDILEFFLLDGYKAYGIDKMDGQFGMDASTHEQPWFHDGLL
jgi:hypothetical protein